MRSLDRALLTLGGAAVGLGVLQLALALPDAESLWWVHLVVTVTYGCFVVAGLLAWHQRPGNPMGMIVALGGFAVLVGTLGNTAVPALETLGAVTATLVLAVTVHLLLAFPSGRLPDPASRAVVVAAYAVALILQAPQYLFDDPVASVGAWVQRAAGAIVVVAAAVLLGGRIARARAAHRRVMVPLFAYGMLALLLVPLRNLVLEPLFGEIPAVVVQFLVIAGVPVTLVLAMLRGGFAREGELEELVARLGDADDPQQTPSALLAHALGDASIQVLYWMPEPAEWVNETGGVTTLPAEQATVEITLADELIAVIAYDSYLIADPEPVRAAGRVLALALERRRLSAQLLAQRDALLTSRARIVTAGDQERRRVARALHDGLQVRLVLLALDAQRIASDAAGDAAVDVQRVVALRRELDQTAGELRAFVHQLMPPALVERGLCAATEDLVDRMPVPTALHTEIADGSLPTEIESTAYFVIAEGLTNALKHAGAERLSVRIGRADERLMVEVRDDGIGGAAPRPGHGLHGLADRVHALGGVLRVQSPVAEGTHLRAELPCRVEAT
ncbi:histidine kinase [Gordonia sp. (in: high G+C Gram-positive bacteria)]|uniref:sensor histidine kinase n=1 Tax=Gordonia sp. (in: high G+C Gram-positive bacteria) TaxID=84139 RepID=UPI0016B3A6EA|nr:histidine kinase [Gordonia sp. (in: high G+C Gram-positive bacteria)]NLG47335.1 sensor histidine kinase [Gordonia sp. (in: high G+C Gram-positive bacteria)]